MIEVGFGFRMVPGPVRSSNATRQTRSRWHWLRKRGNVTFVRPAAEIDDRKERFYLAIASGKRLRIYVLLGTISRNRRVFYFSLHPGPPSFAGKVLRWARLFGVFPLSNITATDPGAFRFHYFSPYIVLSALSIVGGLFIMAAALVRLNRVGINAMNIAEPIFFGMCTLLQLLFVRLAQAWRGFMVYWAEREEMFFARPYGAINLRRKVIGLAVCILTSALGRHVETGGGGLS